jgi:hypothetical protein
LDEGGERTCAVIADRVIGQVEGGELGEGGERACAVIADRVTTEVELGELVSVAMTRAPSPPIWLPSRLREVRWTRTAMARAPSSPIEL